MIRRMILSAAAGVAAIAGLSLTPASAEARPCEPVPICRPVHVARHHHVRHVRFAARECAPRPVVVVPAPTCPTPARIVVPYRR